jgi:catechol 2,3-dioxygenase-like lactoylglutathione lyase family enzyme
MKIKGIDHLVITVQDIDETIAFYNRVLGMAAVTFAKGRKALVFGTQKINLHKAGEEIMPHGKNPVPGSTDLCFITETPMPQVISHLASCNVKILAGPLQRPGAVSSLLSAYIRDPDGNLIEIANKINE